MYHMHCTILHLWLSSTVHTLPYSPLCFWYRQSPDPSYQTFHRWFPHLFCLQSLYMEWPSPSSLKETLSGLLQIRPKNISFSKTIDPLFFPSALLLPSFISPCSYFSLHFFSFFFIYTFLYNCIIPLGFLPSGCISLGKPAATGLYELNDHACWVF